MVLMPLHPFLTVIPVTLAIVLLLLDVVAVRLKNDLAPWPLAAHGLLTVGAVATAMTGQAEAGRIPVTIDWLPLLDTHAALGSALVFLSAGSLLLRLGTQERRGQPRRLAFCAVSMGLAVGFLVAGHLGGRLVMLHGAGVRVPPWDVDLVAPVKGSVPLGETAGETDQETPLGIRKEGKPGAPVDQ